MAFTVEQEAALARIADRDIAMRQADEEKAARIAKAMADLQSRQATLRTDLEVLLAPVAAEMEKFLAAKAAAKEDLVSKRVDEEEYHRICREMFLPVKAKDDEIHASREYLDLVATGDAEVAVLHEALKAEEASGG